jgi:hypothetical protein
MSGIFVSATFPRNKVFCLGSALVQAVPDTQSLGSIMFVLKNGVKDAARRFAVASPSLTPFFNTQPARSGPRDFRQSGAEARSASLDGLKFRSNNRGSVLDKHSLHQSASKASLKNKSYAPCTLVLGSAT